MIYDMGVQVSASGHRCEACRITFDENMRTARLDGLHVVKLYQNIVPFIVSHSMY